MRLPSSGFFFEGTDSPNESADAERDTVDGWGSKSGMPARCKAIFSIASRSSPNG